MDAMMDLRCRTGVTGEPRDTESGHAWFGGGPLEKYLARATRWRPILPPAPFCERLGVRFPRSTHHEHFNEQKNQG
jgi:hypothetical protein